MVKFPHNFLWGAATSAYQVEGNNSNCDWWEWEKRVNLKDKSAEACRHYQLYEQDFDLAKALNHNAQRISIEWSRIEPQDAEFSEAQIEHYLKVILALKARNIEPVITLHHFTNPLWFAKKGGWHNNRSPDHFLRYIEKVVTRLSPHVRYWVTINEPMVYVYHAYMLGFWPPQEKSLFKARRVTRNLLRAHIRAYRLIHNIYRRNKIAPPMVSISHNLQAFQACTPDLKNRISVYLKNKFYNFYFLSKISASRAIDYFGINYYSRSLVEARSWGLRRLMLDTCDKNHSTLKKNFMGWDIYPQGIYELLIKLKKYNLPVMILENGICIDDDNERWDFIRQHLIYLRRAMDEGLKVTGYIYWSLLDNFEWDKGFGPRFGLVEVDYNTYERRVRESAKKFAEVCKTGVLEG